MTYVNYQCVLTLALLPGCLLGQSALSLSPSTESPQLVGATVVWTAALPSARPEAVTYRFSVSRDGQPPEIMKDFSPDPVFVWTPAEREGRYIVAVTARDGAGSAPVVAEVPYEVRSRVSSEPVVTQVQPLVALYSAPPCPEGSLFRVRFWPDAGGAETATPLKPCLAGASMNVYVAGMYANTAYTLVSDVIAFGKTRTSAPLHTSTGFIDMPVPLVHVAESAPRFRRSSQNFVLYAALNAPTFATDLAGKVVWYSYVELTYAMRVNPGGTIMGTYLSDKLENCKLLEFDLAGNILRQTTAPRINEQLAAFGVADAITGFHHDASRLPNGNYIALASAERIVTDVQGPGAVDVLGDIILVLDSNFQVIWAWDSFDRLDLHRQAILGEVCGQFATSGCPPIFKAETANDWLHGNSLVLAPDGNLVYSARHQDLVYKLAYENGAGDGHVIWRLGKDGDFAVASDDPYPWHSHQHDAEFVRGTNLMTLFDNGNTRTLDAGGNSRGQVLEIDEANRRVVYLVNQDLGAYSFALGSAQALVDGGYQFELGASTPSVAVEVAPPGPRRGDSPGVYRATSRNTVYRSFRMKSLYQIE